MVVNEGVPDRVIRLVLAVILAYLVFARTGGAGILGIAGWVLLLTGLSGYCPMYKVVKWNFNHRRPVRRAGA